MLFHVLILLLSNQLTLVERQTDVSAPGLIEALTTADHKYLVMTRFPGTPFKPPYPSSRIWNVFGLELVYAL